MYSKKGFEMMTRPVQARIKWSTEGTDREGFLSWGDLCIMNAIDFCSYPTLLSCYGLLCVMQVRREEGHREVKEVENLFQKRTAVLTTLRRKTSRQSAFSYLMLYTSEQSERQDIALLSVSPHFIAFIYLSPSVRKRLKYTAKNCRLYGEQDRNNSLH